MRASSRDWRCSSSAVFSTSARSITNRKSISSSRFENGGIQRRRAVVLEGAEGHPVVRTLCISTQHSPGIDKQKLRRDILDAVVYQCFPHQIFDRRTVVLINPPT